MQQIKKLKLLIVVAILVFGFGFGSSFLEARNSFSSEVGFSDIDQVGVYLVTVEPRYEVHRMFGHTLIRLVDNSQGIDIAINWGIFDFNESGFLFKFLKGDLYYWVEAYSFRSQMNFWKRDGCTVWQDRLNLTSNQKRRLVDRILTNLKEENKYFKYSYFRKNCATYPRDYIDEVLLGYVQKKYSDKTNLTYRKDALTNLSLNPFTYMGVDLIFNSNTDKPVSIWERMYKPGILREGLLKLNSMDDSGNLTQDLLLLDSKLLTESDPAITSRFNGYDLFSLMCILIFLISFYYYRRAKQNNPTYMLLIGVYTLFSTFAGLILVFFWTMTNQIDCVANFNLFMFWPVDIGALFVIWWLSRIKRGSMLFRYYCILRILLCIGGILGYLVSFIEQDISRIILYLAPIHILVYVLMLNFELNMRKLFSSK